MLLSIFTPTNNVRHLNETYDSLLLQGHKNFEWVLIANGGVAPHDVPARIRADRRVVVKQFEHKHVGALKRYACDTATGDAFVELDHDDLLLPGALARIAACFAEGAGFVFSDVACFEDGTLRPQQYHSDYGWTNYPIRVYNRTFYATRAFPVTARSLCSVHYAPDHVRCWSREAYYQAGGHDRDLLVADDHDLICRTYLAKVPFRHTGGCEYLYRFHRDNTVKRYNDEIQKLQKANQDKYLYRLVDEWLRRTGLPFVQLAWDRDWSAPLPHPTSSVGCVKLWNVVQYVPKDLVPFVFSEIHRVLVPGGWCALKAPSTDGRGAWLPSHKSFWNEEVVRCLCYADAAKRELPAYGGRFQSVRCWTAHDNTDAERRKLPSVLADLLAVKERTEPGRVYI